MHSDPVPARSSPIADYFLSVCGFCYALLPFMNLVFFSFSFFTNTLSSGEFVNLCAVGPIEAYKLHLREALLVWRVLRSKGPEVDDSWKWHSRAIFNFVRYRRVFEAIIQSAAIYSTASLSLLITTFVSPNIGLYACLCAFPPLIVRHSVSVCPSQRSAYIASLGSSIFTHRDPDWAQIWDLGTCPHHTGLRIYSCSANQRSTIRGYTVS